MCYPPSHYGLQKSSSSSHMLCKAYILTAPLQKVHFFLHPFLQNLAITEWCWLGGCIGAWNWHVYAPFCVLSFSDTAWNPKWELFSSSTSEPENIRYLILDNNETAHLEERTKASRQSALDFTVKVAILTHTHNAVQIQFVFVFPESWEDLCTWSSRKWPCLSRPVFNDLFSLEYMSDYQLERSQDPKDLDNPSRSSKLFTRFHIPQNLQR